MATPPQNQTGGSRLANEAASAATNLAGPALDLAQGATAMQAATNALKGAALDKLLGPTAVLAGGLIGVLRTMKSIVDQSGILERGLKRISSLQQIQGKFETLLKSAEEATKRIKELYKFTASSPFDFSDVAEANRTLEALTKGAFSNAEAMRMVGDVAAATGQDISTVAERMGKLNAALRSGRSLDKVLFQMQGMGAVTDSLAARLETLQQAGAGFTEMWAEVEKSIAHTEGAMQAEMKTLEGLSKRLNDASKTMEKAFATPFVDAQAKAIESTIQATQNLTPVLAKIGEDIAPLLTFFRNVKNEVVVATLATKGFADMLRVAWEGGKALFTGVAVASLASMTATLIKAAAGAREFATGLAAAHRAAMLTEVSMAGFARAAALSSAASAAFASNQFLAAASLKAQAVWAKISTIALNVHTVALARVGAATGLAAVANYTLAASAQLAGGAVKLLGRALMFVVGGLKAAVLAHPILAAGAAISAAVVAAKSWADAQAKVNEEYNKTILNLAAVREGIRKQIAEVRNLDQYRQALLDTDKKIADVDDEIAANKRPEGTMQYSVGLDGTVRATGMSAPDPKAVADHENKLAEQQRTRAALVAERTRLLNRSMSTIGLGAEEQAKLGDRVAGDLATADAARQAGASGADDYGRLAFLRSERARLASEAAIGRAIDQGRTSKERLNGPTELERVAQQIDAAEKAGMPVDPSLYRRRAELGNMADTFAQKEQALPGMDAEIKALEDTVRMKELELYYDMEIAKTRADGGNVGLVTAQKELAVLREQLRVAQSKGDLGIQEAAAIRAKIAEANANRKQFQDERALERAKDNATVNGSKRAAQALDDARELKRLRDEYAANGLTAGQADADFALSLRAQAKSAQPRIVADSLQSIGGGGGSYSGGNPMLEAARRAEAARKTANDLLTIIARNTGKGQTVQD